jgi:hypothetical protein
MRASYFNSVPIVQNIISQSISEILHAKFHNPSGYQNILLALLRQSDHHTGIAPARTLIRSFLVIVLHLIGLGGLMLIMY